MNTTEGDVGVTQVFLKVIETVKSLNPLYIIWFVTVIVETLSHLAVAKKCGNDVRQAFVESLWSKMGELFVVVVAVIMDQSGRVAITYVSELYAQWPENVLLIVIIELILVDSVRILKNAERLGVEYLRGIKKVIDTLDNFFKNWGQ